MTGDVPSRYLQILGPLTVTVGSEPWSQRRTRNARVEPLLCALLIMGSEGLPVGEIHRKIFELKLGDAGGQADGLKQALSSLRRELKLPDDGLRSEQDVVRLRIPADELDADRFRVECRTGRQALDDRRYGEAAGVLKRALDRWRESDAVLAGLGGYRLLDTIEPVVDRIRTLEELREQARLMLAGVGPASTFST